MFGGQLGYSGSFRGTLKNYFSTLATLLSQHAKLGLLLILSAFVGSYLIFVHCIQSLMRRGLLNSEYKCHGILSAMTNGSVNIV